MEKKTIIFMSALFLLSACSSAQEPFKKSKNTLLGYLNDRGEINLDLTENSGPYIDIYIPDTTNEKVLEETDYIVYAEVDDVNYYIDDMPKSIVQLTVLDSLGPKTAPQTLYLGSDQCILPARQAIADPAEAAKAMEAYEKDPENNWIPDEDDFYIQIMPEERFYKIGDRYIFLLKEKKSESSREDQTLYIPVYGSRSSFLEVEENQFVNVGRINSESQTLSLDLQDIPVSSISPDADYLTLEDFAVYAEGGELPTLIVYKVNTVKKLD